MAKNPISKILFFSGIAVLVAGTGFYFYQQWLLTDYLCYGLKKFKFKKIGLLSTSIDVILEIENKGELNIDLDRMTFDIYANGTMIASVNQQVKTSIKPLNKAELPLEIDFSPKKIIGNILNIVSATTLNDMSFRFVGKAVIKKFGIPISIPFDFSYTVAEMKEPSSTNVCEDKKNK